MSIDNLKRVIQQYYNNTRSMNRYKKYLESAHIVVDIETTGLDMKNGSPILSIGASHFKYQDQVSGNASITDQFYGVLDLGASHMLGFKDDPDTLDWWSTQDAEVFKEATTSGKDPLVVITEFFKYLTDVTNEYRGSTVFVWGNAPEIDIAFIERYLDKWGIESPFPHYITRDIRTQCHNDILDSDTHKSMYQSIPFKHHALYDAVAESAILFTTLNNIDKAFNHVQAE